LHSPKIGNIFPKMPDKLFTTMQQVSALVLRPLVRLLLKHGVSAQALEAELRAVLVSEGASMLEKQNQKATVSAIAVLTGLSRKEVKRLQDLQRQDIIEEVDSRNRVVRTISAWCNEASFSTDGNPRVLPLSGEDSFSELVRRFSGDMTSSTMLQTLRNAGNVETSGDRVTLVKKEYLPLATSSERLMLFGTDVSELMETIEHNLDGAYPVRFQRKVSNHLVNRDAIAEFVALSNQQSMALLERYDTWLSEHEVEEDDPNAEYVAVGIFFAQKGV
jgi:hypothetical protein